MKPWQVLLAGVFFGLLASAVILLLAAPPRGTPIQLLPTATPQPVRVQVTGEVAHPGLFTLPEGSRVEDALSAAGGASASANLERINLAARLEDGQKIVVPDKAQPEPPAPSRSNPLELGAAGEKINLNTALLEQLDTLPGIGMGKAEDIIAFREKNGPFDKIEAIMDVPGIGEGIFAQIKDLVTVGP